MKSLCVLSMYILYCITCISVNYVFGKHNEKYCDESVYFKPYARFYNQENGNFFFEVSSGFQTLQLIYNLYLCINGPVLFYASTEQTRQAERRFYEPKFGLYVHQCVQLNPPQRPSYETPQKFLGKILSTTQIPPIDCKSNYTLEPGADLLPPLPDFRDRFWGMMMLGEPQDYRLPRVNFFYDTFYEVRSDTTFPIDLTKPPPRTATGAFGLSIISCGEIVHCLQVPGKSFQLTLGALHKPELRSRICFRPQMSHDEYFKNLTDVSQVSSGREVPTEAGGGEPCNINVTLSIPDCFPFPTFGDDCKKHRPDIDRTCAITSIVIGLDKPELITEPTLEWRVEILDLISNIFIKVCPIIPHQFLTIMKSLMSHYILNENQMTPFPKKKDYWKFINDDIKDCSHGVKPHKFNQINFTTIYNYKRDIYFYNKTSYGGQYKTTRPLKLFYFQEKADIVYKLNRIIDMQWIIFATTLGICPIYYNRKTGSTSGRLYTYFVEDFLIPLKEIWIDDTDNQIFELLLGKFINDEILIQSLTCLEASYVQSNTVVYRHQRPLLLFCNEEDNSFIEVPGKYFYDIQSRG